MKNDVQGTEADLAVEAKVEAASTWTPSEWSRFKRQSRAMMRELLQEAKVHEGRLSDLYDRIYPGADCDCDPWCAKCKRAVEIAAVDPLVQEVSSLLGVWGQVAGLNDAVDEPGDDRELERLLRKVPARPSNWVEMARRRRHDRAAGGPAPAPESERPLTLEERPHPDQMSGLEKCQEIAELAERLSPEQFHEVLGELRARVEWHRALRRANEAAGPDHDPIVQRVVRAAALLAELDHGAVVRIAEDLERRVEASEPGGDAAELSALRAESEEAYQRVAKVIREVHGELMREAREAVKTQ